MPIPDTGRTARSRGMCSDIGWFLAGVRPARVGPGRVRRAWWCGCFRRGRPDTVGLGDYRTARAIRIAVVVASDTVMTHLRDLGRRCAGLHFPEQGTAAQRQLQSAGVEAGPPDSEARSSAARPPPYLRHTPDRRGGASQGGAGSAWTLLDPGDYGSVRASVSIGG